MNDLISVIVPVYNCEKYLEKCISSIINQTYKNLEIILVDDNSTDKSSIICDSFKLKDDRIKVIHNKKGGSVSKARNIGIDVANGKYIGFVDSDDFIEESMFEILYDNLIKNNCDLSMCNFNVCSTKGSFLSNHNEIINNTLIIDNKNDFYKLLNKNYYKGFLWNKLFLAEKVKKIKMHNDIHICEDLVFVCEYAAQCDRFVFDKRGLYNYIIRKNSAINSNYNFKKLSVIDAYKIIIDIINKYAEDEIINYKISLFNWYNDIIHKYHDHNDLKRKIECKNLYKEIMKNNFNLSTFIRYRFYYIFNLVRTLYFVIRG